MAAFFYIVIFLVAILLLIFWIRQFFDLMARTDDTFPGKYDKVIWAAVFLLTYVFGAFLYLIFKLEEDITQITESKKARIEYPQPCLKCGKTIPPDATKCPSCGWSYQNEK